MGEEKTVEMNKTITVELNKDEAGLISQVLGKFQLNADQSLIRSIAMNKIAVEWNKVFEVKKDN